MKIKYSLFIPCYNEAKCIKKNVLQVFHAMNNFNKNFEIIVVDDCSTDNTPEILDSISNKKIKVIHYTGKKPTRRENLIRSFIQAKGEIIAFLDADMSTDLRDLPNLLNGCESFDVCIGNRYDKKSIINRSSKRYFISKCLNLVTKLAYPTGLSDHFIGFKAFKKPVILDLLKKTGVGIPNRGMWWDGEMLIQARVSKYSIKPIPVKWHEGKQTNLNFQRDFKMLKYIFLYKLNRAYRKDSLFHDKI